jgi:hypothetical protein
MATCADVIAYLQQFHPDDTVWVWGKPPKKPQEITTKEN